MGNKIKAKDLPYRPCVGIMVLNDAGLVWAGKRISNNERDEYKDSPYEWQMPQGSGGAHPVPGQPILQLGLAMFGSTWVVPLTNAASQCARSGGDRSAGDERGRGSDGHHKPKTVTAPVPAQSCNVPWLRFFARRWGQ